MGEPWNGCCERQVQTKRKGSGYTEGANLLSHRSGPVVTSGSGKVQAGPRRCHFGGLPTRVSQVALTNSGNRGGSTTHLLQRAPRKNTRGSLHHTTCALAKQPERTREPRRDVLQSALRAPNTSNQAPPSCSLQACIFTFTLGSRTTAAKRTNARTTLRQRRRCSGVDHSVRTY